MCAGIHNYIYVTYSCQLCCSLAFSRPSDVGHIGLLCSSQLIIPMKSMKDVRPRGGNVGDRNSFLDGKPHNARFIVRFQPFQSDGKRSLFHGKKCARNWYGGFQPSNMWWEVRTIIAIQHQHSVRFWKPTFRSVWKLIPKSIKNHQNPMVSQPFSIPFPHVAGHFGSVGSPGHRFSIISKGTLMPPPPMPGAPAKNGGKIG